MKKDTKPKKEAMVHVNLRVPAWVLEHYRKTGAHTVAMRETLEKAAKRQRT